MATMSAGSLSQWNAQARGCSPDPAAAARESWPANVGPAAAASAARLSTFGLARSLLRNTDGQAAAGLPDRLGTTVCIPLKPNDAMPSKTWCCPCRTIVKQTVAWLPRAMFS